MKFWLYIFFIPVAVFLIYFVFFDSPQTQPQNPQIKRETKIDGQSSVTVQITPIELPATGQWKFNIALDTHSGSLDEDLTTITVLLDDNGNKYQPINWDGASPGGHHREGVLIFNAINPVPEFIELKMQNVGGVVERSFKWNLK